MRAHPASFSPLLLVLTGFALVGFAANSVLCRLALGSGVIGAADFTLVRLAAGAAMLVLLGRFRQSRPKARGSWGSAAALAVYAGAFSFAYLTLSTGTGALILFGAVQLTMVGAALYEGERLGWRDGGGAAVAFAGLAYLVWPGVAAPAPVGAALMAAAGVAWGIYSLRGRGAGDPLAVTGSNFLRALSLAALLLLAGRHQAWSTTGFWLAVVSGAVASALAYVAWYAAVHRMRASRAAVVQLAVPILAALGGVVFLGERPGLRLLLATAAVLGGIGLAVTAAPRSRRS